MLAVIDATASAPTRHVIYCRGCQHAWVQIEHIGMEAPLGDDCACSCTNPAEPLYEAWIVDPDEDDLPEGVWVS